MQDLRITTLQADLHWEDKQENLKMFEKLIKNITEPTDLILLPEMFNTGFSMRANELAEEMGGYTVQWMIKMAQEKNSAIAGSIIIKENNKYYNRLLFVQENGEIKWYNKHHLFSMGDEHKYYTAGTERLQIEYKTWKLNFVVCYDLRFGAWLQNNKNDAYDALIVVANWPEKRMEHWDALLKARAIENQAYVIGVNRIGLDGNEIPHTGHTSIYHPFGTQEYFSEISEAHTHTLSRYEINLNRRQFPFIKDMDE